MDGTRCSTCASIPEMNEISQNAQHMKHRRILDACLVALAIASFIVAAAALLFGRVSGSIAGLRVSSGTLFRPAAVGFVALLIATRISTERAQQISGMLQRAARRPRSLALGLAMLAFLLAIHFGT